MGDFRHLLNWPLTFFFVLQFLWLEYFLQPVCVRSLARINHALGFNREFRGGAVWWLFTSLLPLYLPTCPWVCGHALSSHSPTATSGAWGGVTRGGAEFTVGPDGLDLVSGPFAWLTCMSLCCASVMPPCVLFCALLSLLLRPCPQRVRALEDVWWHSSLTKAEAERGGLCPRSHPPCLGKGLSLYCPSPIAGSKGRCFWVNPSAFVTWC